VLRVGKNYQIWGSEFVLRVGKNYQVWGSECVLRVGRLVAGLG